MLGLSSFRDLLAQSAILRYKSLQSSQSYEVTGSNILSIVVLTYGCGIRIFSQFPRLFPQLLTSTRSSATAKSTARPPCLVGVLYFSGDGYQQLLRNGPRKLPNSAK